MGLRLGLAYPTDTNRASPRFNRGYIAGLGYFRAPFDWLELGVECDAQALPTQYVDSVVFEDAANRITLRAKRRAKTGSALATARINLVFDRPWTIYVKGGAGIHKTTISEFFFINNERNGQTADISSVASGRGLATMAAGGIEAFTNRNVSLALEARYEEYRLPTSKFTIDSIEFLSYNLGFRYWFGQH